jgi:hypothetical protein
MTTKRFHAGSLIVAAGLAITIAACGTGTANDFLTPIGGGPGSGSDHTPPTLVTTNPQNLSTGVPTNATISATFSEPLDSASVTNAAFSFDNGVTGRIAVNGAVVTFTPSPALPAGTTMRGTFSTAIRDRAGNALATPVSFQFTTAP